MSHELTLLQADFMYQSKAWRMKVHERERLPVTLVTIMSLAEVGAGVRHIGTSHRTEQTSWLFHADITLRVPALCRALRGGVQE